jgi:hypothetical protein
MNSASQNSTATPDFHPVLSFTRFTARKPARLSKRFSLVGNVLTKESGGNMTDGIAERLTLTFGDVPALLLTLKPSQATSYGIAAHDAARVVVADAISTAGNGDLPVIARTRDYFSWPDGAGLMMLDYDAPADGDPLNMTQLRDGLAMACLPLDSAPAVWRPSASSCIHVKGGAELRGIAGQRLYIPVIDASDLSRAGQVLFDRLWLAGYGRYELSKSGAFLARSLIDASVFQPERLDFCGGASLGAGLEQRLPEPIIFNPDAPYLDTRAALPDLDDDERARLTTMQDAAKSAMSERQAQVREQWVIERVGERLATMPEPAQEAARPRLEAVYRQAVDGGYLAPGFELTVKAKGVKTINKVTVGDALAQKTKYHEAICLDPLEPDYPDGAGRFVGWLNLVHKPPYVTSQAHGGTKYFLGVAPAAAESGPERQEDDPGCGDMPDWFASVPLEPVVVGTKAKAKAKVEKKTADTQRTITIQCIPGELPEMVDQAEAALCRYEANFYQRSGQLVRWCVSHAETVRGIARPGGAVIILNQDTDYLLDRLNRLISWERWNEDKEDYVPCNAPRTVASTMLARRGMWNAQPLVAAINAPTLRPDGSILDAPGYDAATGLLFVNTAVDFPPIPQQPTQEQAANALAFLIKEVLSGFPFAAPHDRAAALSAILTGCIRHSLKAAPMHTFNAPVMASGKSLLADVVALIATGHPATVMSYTPDGDEMRKRVLSVLMQGDLVVNLDNVEEPLASQTLCSVLTQESFTDRILGVNKTGTAPTLCCWIATGNNLVVAGDLTTRIVPCNLDPMVERPEEREFQRNLYDWIPIHRPRLVQMVLTVMRGYITAGKPKQPIKNFARFEDWSGLVRSALIWLGEADPLTGREAIEDGDPIRVKLRALLLAWYGAFKTAPATSKEAVLRAGETELDNEGQEQPRYPGMKEALEEHFSDKSGKISSRYLGEFLKKYAGRVDIGARFESSGISHHAVNWRIVIVDKNRFGKIYAPEGNNSPDSHDSPKSPHWKSSKSPEAAAQADPPKAPPPQTGESGEFGESVSPGPEILPEKISAAAAELATVFASSFRGWVTEHDVAKQVGWPPAQTAAALAELVKAGIAKQSGKLYKPVVVAVAEVQE